MKKYFYNYCMILAVLFALTACEGNKEVDPRDIFVGTYSYEATGSVEFKASPLHWNIPLDETGTFTITKEGNQDKVVITGWNDPINATVSGTQLILESNTYSTTYGDIALTFSFTYEKATLVDNSLTWKTDVSGVGQYSGFSIPGTGSVSMVATKNVEK